MPIPRRKLQGFQRQKYRKRTRKPTNQEPLTKNSGSNINSRFVASPFAKNMRNNIITKLDIIIPFPAK